MDSTTTPYYFARYLDIMTAIYIEVFEAHILLLVVKNLTCPVHLISQLSEFLSYFMPKRFLTISSIYIVVILSYFSHHRHFSL